MNQPYRLPDGGNIERGTPLRFTFNGRDYHGFRGDTLASALLANGVRLVARSFKYHRPRGIFSAGSEEPNALVQLGTGATTQPNLKATQIELFDGLTARSVNCWPSPAFDVRGLHQLFSAMMPAGFYYKTFKRPHWHWFEGAIRRAAGLGIAPTQVDPDRYDEMHATADITIVGAGPAGLAAASAAAAAGAQVILIDDQPELGGSLHWRSHEFAAGSQWARTAIGDLARQSNVRVLTRTLVTGYYDHDSLVAVEHRSDGGVRQRLWQIRARRILLATGATERPLVFAGNDRPGVMLADSVLQYVKRYAVLPGKRAVLFTTNDAAYEVAIRLHQAGASVAAIVDVNEVVSHALADQARQAGIVVLSGSVVSETHGARALRAVTVMSGGTRRRIDCDLLCVSGGWSPNVHLHSQSGGSLRFDDGRGMFVPAKSAQSSTSVGAANGTMTLAETFEEAAAAGRNAIESLGLKAVSTPLPTIASREFQQCVAWNIAGSSGKAFVDQASDVTRDDVALAARENYASVEHLKRYTTLGMGVDQGRTSNVNGLALLGENTQRQPQQVGTTRFRPPFSPVTMGTIANLNVGELYRPLKYLPAHEWHVTHGAVFEEAGGWLRPVAYPRAGEHWEATAQREALHVRQAVGVLDSSSLGKIEVAGPDAAAFLDRIYVGTVSSLGVGRARYGLMLNENGVVIDDGVVVRLAPQRYLVHTTSGGAERIGDWLEDWLQCEYLEMNVTIAPVTTQWANFAVSGPHARSVLERLGTDIDLAAESFPHMSVREGTIAGLPTRICRVSFTGELSYEVNVPAGQGTRLLAAIMSAGREFDIAPFGLEALMILRTEKGYLHVGGDTDGTTLPTDIGMAGKVAQKQSDFVGRRSLLRSASAAEDRLQFVGLSSSEPLPVGAHVMTGPAPCLSDGHVTSSAHSPTLKGPVALGVVRNGRQRMGEDIDVYHLGRVLRARIVPPAFFDPSGARLNG